MMKRRSVSVPGVEGKEPPADRALLKLSGAGEENGNATRKEDAGPSSLWSGHVMSPGVFQVGNVVILDPNEVLHDPLLSTLHQWNFDIFKLSKQRPLTILSSMFYRILADTGLLTSFRLPQKELVLYLHALESGYRSVPYHNRMHAADVLHGVFFLCTQPVTGLEYQPRSPEQRSTAQLDVIRSFYRNLPKYLAGQGLREPPRAEDPAAAGHGVDVVAEDTLAKFASPPYGSVAANLTRIELLAVLLAAAMHDFDHPGRNNRFLVDTQAPLALLYNDRSVLEQHHASASWSLLVKHPELNFLKYMDPGEFSKLRRLTIECILATDLERHVAILSDFKAKTERDVDWSQDSVREAVLLVAIKLADVSGPCKRFDLYERWIDLLSQEFFKQGDEERARGLAMSPFMDRHQPQTAVQQESFIRNVVAPLAKSYAAAGLMPSYWLPTPRSIRKVDHTTQLFCSGLSSSENGDVNNNEQKVHCLLLKQLQDNYNYWLIKEEKHKKVNISS